MRHGDLPTPRLQPACPRCGYDLTGAVEAWGSEQCPVEGICSECGLRVLWRDVLNPVYAVSDQFFETARRRLFRAFFRTWWQSMRPWCLWRGAQMQFPVNTRRLTVFAVLGVALAWLIGAGTTVTPMLLLSRALWGMTWESVVAAALWPAAPSWWWWWGSSRLSDVFPPWLAVGWLWLAATPLTFRFVPQTLRRARVRRSHLLRIWAYSLVGVPLLLYVPALCHPTP